MEDKIKDIIENLEKYHEDFYKANRFDGPSHYFHLKALESRFDCENFSVFSYALLTAWGMHRMGKGGAKMVDFQSYRSSICDVWKNILHAREFDCRNLGSNEWKTLKEIFFGIRAMQTKVILVANSKVLCHALPELFAPIDRQYILAFLLDKKSIDNREEKQFSVFKKLMEEFYYKIIFEKGFRDMASKWLVKRNEFPWDTSLLKIVDNLIIGSA